MSDLEDRVRRLEDRQALSDLAITYALLLDDERFDEVGELFTVDGIFASPNSTTVGRQAIVENFRIKHAPYTATLHDPHGQVVEFIDDDNARGTVIGYAELGGSDHCIVTSIRYQDDYVREDGRWRFSRRFVLSVFGMTPQEHAAGGLGLGDRKRWPGRPVGAAELPDVAHRFTGYPGMP